MKRKQIDFEDDIKVKDEEKQACTTSKLKRRKVVSKAESIIMERTNCNALSMPGHGSVPVDSYASLLSRAAASSLVGLSTNAPESTKVIVTPPKKRERTPKSVNPSLDTRVERVSVAPFACIETRPYELEASKTLLSNMYLANLYIPDAQTSQLPKLCVRELLDQKLIVLPLIESHFADMLLHESGHYPVLYYDSGAKTWHEDSTVKRDYPACDYGNECVCMTMGFEALDGTIPQGFICTQLILPAEYTRLVDSNIQPPKRPCVLCSRHKSGMFVPFIQSLCRKKTMEINTREFVLDENEHFQLFREIKDANEGYIGRYMTIPRHGAWEGYVDPICKLNHELLQACVRHSNSKRKFIDQSLLKHNAQDKLDIEVGEQLSHF